MDVLVHRYIHDGYKRKGSEVMENIIEVLRSMSEEELLDAYGQIAELLGVAEASLLQLLIEMELDVRNNK